MTIARNLKGKDLDPSQIDNKRAATLVSAVVVQFSTKQVANAAGCTIEAAKKWRGGHNAPTLAHAINAARQIPELNRLLVGLLQPPDRGATVEAHVGFGFLSGLAGAAAENPRVRELLNELEAIMAKKGGK